MDSPNVILCPTDFSECSLNAIEYAARIGERYGSTLILIHVANREDYFKLNPLSNEADYQLAFLKEKLSNLQQTVRNESIPKGLKECHVLICEGDIVKELIKASEETKAQLLVMGTEGMNELRKNIIGSRTSRIVEKSKVDVLVVPRKVFYKQPRKLVFGTDYREEDKVAIQKIVEFAKFFDAEIDIVHASEGKNKLEKPLHQVMIEELKPFIKYDRVNFVLKTFRDDLALGLENYLQSAKGDMLITLSRQRDFFNKIFTKSVSKKMSYFITKPLWVIKNF
ncbi:universal stress protein [Algoriphagus kandeliae]|uniref:Universal stress protein n=1 Tax=Algoriphagus kandeliae TaxID=2562278 RepID=A0A4Y9R2U3_9BACT|nr:universal stress protein [Algoriphagus kandeliae]TFV97846.1 universal stress protein [Algoriphagus kandeliae]